VATYAFGIKAFHPSATAGDAHVLGMATGRSSGSLVEVWNGVSSSGKVLAIMYRGDVIPSNGSSELATTATGPFIYITGGNGVPTGVPTSAANGFSPLYIDRSNGRLYVYHSAGWHYAALT